MSVLPINFFVLLFTIESSVKIDSRFIKPINRPESVQYKLNGWDIDGAHLFWNKSFVEHILTWIWITFYALFFSNNMEHYVTDLTFISNLSKDFVSV